MSKIAILASLSALALSTPVLAADVTGASLDFSHYNFADADARDSGRSTLGGQMVIGFTPQFSVQGDAGIRHFRDGDWNDASWGLHAIYNAYDMATVGVFAGYEEVDGREVDSIGLEYGTSYNGADIQAAWTNYDGHDGLIDGNIYNVSASMPLNSELSVGGRADFLDLNGGRNSRRIGATGTYSLAGGYDLNGELGLIDDNGDDAEPYIGLGVSTKFGNGATFNRRGLAEFLPGL
ncbi:porin [Thioclava sp. SK-1]|uniref:porin n=1 Tax=Thioclava sp. SK-1 TaxID=1889770 RepID=UPI00114CDB7D|nr:porin [Thioclava sp. SK-1]